MKRSGFSTVELLITLFIAALFLTSGYQLFTVVIRDSSESRARAKASNIAYDYLQQYKSYATNPCTTPPITPEPDNSLPDGAITVTITCPYPEDQPSVSKISVTVKYRNSQQSVTEATYVKK